MSYSDEEVTAAVGKIVRTSIRRQYGALGNRRTDLTFNDVQDAAAGMFIVKPKASFYVVKLGVDRLRRYLEVAQDQVELLLELVQGTGRNVRNVEDLSHLANARSALSSLVSATSSRSSSFDRVEDIPAFKRFEDNTQKFLDESSGNIVQDGELVRTPAEARKMLGSSFTTMEQYHGEVVRRAGLLASAMDDYASMSLPQTLAASIMENARDLLDDRYEELTSLSPSQRLEKLREVTLDVLTARATVGGLGSLNSPTTFYLLDGYISTYADSFHPALPASITSDYYGPYPITSTAYELRFTVEGDVITIPIQGSFVAKFESVIVETYDIGNPNADGVINHQLRVGLFNYPTLGTETTWDITFSTNATKPIWDVVNEINGVVDPTADPLIAEPYLQPRKWTGGVDITEPGTTYDVEFDATNPSIDFTNLNPYGLAIVVGDRLIVRDGSSSYDEHIVEVKAVSATKIEGDFLYPAVPSSGSETDKNVEVGEALALRLRITEEANDNGYIGAVDYQYDALVDKVRIIVPTTGPSGDDVQYNAATTLGLFPGMEVRSTSTSAADVASSITKSALNNTFASGLLVPRVQVTREFEALYYSGRARSMPNDFLRVVCFKFQGVGDVTGGTIVTFNVSGAQTAGVQVGDSIALRTSSYAGEADTFGLVTSVSDTSIGATMYSAITADTGVQVEVGPRLDIVTIGYDATLVIEGETGNEGTYQLEDDYTEYRYMEVKLDRTLPYPNGTGNAPIEFDVQVGRYKLVLETLDETLSSQLRVDDQATNDVFGIFFDVGQGTSREEYGQTVYWKLPEWPKGLEVGDLLEYFTAPGVALYSSPIVGLEQSSLLIEVQQPADVSTPALPMQADASYPNAKIRRRSFNSFSSLEGDLTQWLGTPEAKTIFFHNLRALLNPLVTGTNPTAAQLGSTSAELEKLYLSFVTLDGYLSGYGADVVSEVDTLIQAFQEKGADRAMDVLLEGRFSDFFGLDQDEVSYAGTMQKAIKDVSREDLPVRKTGRSTTRGVQQSMLAEYDDKDFEFARDEVDGDLGLDIPVG